MTQLCRRRLIGITEILRKSMYSVSQYPVGQGRVVTGDGQHSARGSDEAFSGLDDLPVGPWSTFGPWPSPPPHDESSTVARSGGSGRTHLTSRLRNPCGCRQRNHSAVAHVGCAPLAEIVKFTARFQQRQAAPLNSFRHRSLPWLVTQGPSRERNNDRCGYRESIMNDELAGEGVMGLPDRERARVMCARSPVLHLEDT